MDKRDEKLQAIMQLAISRILDDAKDVKESEVNDFTDGKRIAYIEVLGAIQNALEHYDVDLETYHLNFDVDNYF